MARGKARDGIVIVAARRTPMGGLQGDFKDVAAPQLGAVAIASAVAQSGIAPEAVDQTLFGCVLSAGQGQAPARQASLGAGLPVSAAATTINKMCGSGMQAAILGHDLIAAGSSEVVVAGGMESMSNAPYLLDRARAGYRMGHGRVIDHMFLDGLEDAYDKGRLMGTFAEDCAQSYQFTRAAQDGFAIRSLERAIAAARSGAFEAEIAPVSVRDGKAERIVSADEQPPKAKLDKIPLLKPAFRTDGTVTAANASSISDGAAALILMREAKAEKLGVRPLARIAGHSVFADKPERFPTAPIGAIEKLLQRTGWSADSVDLYEINEAFAVVTMAAMKTLRLPDDKVNIHGGACALGHPIGASGARIVVTLLNALERYGKTRGVASLCIGGGEATALAIERIG